jgi:hypothetical protein
MAQLSKIETLRLRIDALRSLEREAQQEYKKLLRKQRHKKRMRTIQGPPAPKGIA